MSLYPPSYGAPPPHGYHASYPPPPPPQLYPPQPSYHELDPNSFRRDYTNRLAELTFNSRPIIQTLSVIAQDYSHWSYIVAECIEAHIRTAHPSTKLPAFYLLDATAKNVYNPYARAFAPFVVHLFLDSYYQVDHATRSKMDEMLITWRTGSPTGTELFGVNVQASIERNIWGSGSDPSSSSSGYGHVSKNQVLAELDFTLEQKRRALHADPYDATASRHVDILQQLRYAVEGGVSSQDLNQILQQLRALTQSPPQSHTAPPPPPPHVPFTYPAAHLSPPTSVNALPPHSVQQPRVAFDRLSVPPPTSSNMPLPSAVPPAAPAITNILQSLLKAGVVSIPGTPIGAGNASASSQEDSKPIDPHLQSIRTYRETIMSLPMKLSTADITKQRPQNVTLLYDRLPTQCKQCGLRFADDAQGKQRNNNHLDMHFRQNRKANQNVGRGHSRSWFVSVDDWVHDVSDPTGTGGPRTTNAKTAAHEEAVRRDASLREMHVIVPPGEEAKTIACPICKEILKSEFLEDEEEWVWKNAIKSQDRIYHATCHAEAKATTSGIIAARMRTAASRSRSVTPETLLKSNPLKDVKIAKASPPPSSITGTKRKAQDDPESSEPGQQSTTPPMKKIATTA